MGLYQFRLPDVGEGVAEAEITVWHIAVGDVVKEDQSLVDVMTDKATVDLTSPVDGIVNAIHGEVGAMVPVGSVLVELLVPEEAASTETEMSAGADEGTGMHAAAVDVPAEPVSGTPAEAGQPKHAPAPFTPRSSEPFGSVPAAAPSTRRRAKQAGIDLRHVRGSGPAGRITSYDFDAFMARTPASAASSVADSDARYATRTAVHDTRIIGLRRRIAEKMQEAKRRIPHIAYVEEFDVTELEALRRDLNLHKAAEQPKLTLLPFFIRALVRVLPDFPQINAVYDDEAGLLHAHEAVHVGVATQTPGGLMVPVIRHAETRNVWALADELIRVSKAARTGNATREELSGSTITLTSLGTLGGIATTPVINHPEVAIIGPNKIVDRPVMDGSFVTVRKMMNLSSSFDHRIVDGYDAALFIQKLKRLIERPALIFMD